MLKISSSLIKIIIATNRFAFLYKYKHLFLLVILIYILVKVYLLHSMLLQYLSH